MLRLLTSHKHRSDHPKSPIRDLQSANATRLSGREWIRRSSLAVAAAALNPALENWAQPRAGDYKTISATCTPQCGRLSTRIARAYLRDRAFCLRCSAVGSCRYARPRGHRLSCFFVSLSLGGIVNARRGPCETALCAGWPHSTAAGLHAARAGAPQSRSSRPSSPGSGSQSFPSGRPDHDSRKSHRR